MDGETKAKIRDLRNAIGCGKHTDEESPGESPFLDAADDGERKPMSGNEGMEKRNGRNSSDCGQIFCGKTFHLVPK